MSFASDDDTNRTPGPTAERSSRPGWLVALSGLLFIATLAALGLVVERGYRLASRDVEIRTLQQRVEELEESNRE